MPKGSLSGWVASAAEHLPGPVARRLGNRSVVARAVRPFVNRALPSEEMEVTCRSGLARGLRFVIDPRSEKFYWTGAYEIPVQEALGEVLHDGATYWDVGSHAGFFALAAARRVGPSGRVHAFEPSEPNRTRLLGNVRANGLTNVEVHGEAVTDRSGVATLFSHPSTSMWTIVEGKGSDPAAEVPCTTLDELGSKLGAPDVIKIDVEGAELAVLKGGAELLERDHPTVVIELSEESQVGEMTEVAAGYEVRRLDGRHWLLT